MTQEILNLIGIVLFGVAFFVFGLNHFQNLDTVSGYAESAKIPFAKFWVIVTGLLFFAVAFVPSLKRIPIANLTDYVLGALAVFLVVSAFKFHLSKDQHPHFLKNIALAGASILLMNVF